MDTVVYAEPEFIVCVVAIIPAPKLGAVANIVAKLE